MGRFWFLSKRFRAKSAPRISYLPLQRKLTSGRTSLVKCDWMNYVTYRLCQFQWQGLLSEHIVSPIAYRPERISNAELWKQTTCEKMKLMIKRRKWNWIGHTLRPTCRKHVEVTALDWNPPQGARRLGRPKVMWKRPIVDEARLAEKEWTEVNRVRWWHFVDILYSPEE